MRVVKEEGAEFIYFRRVDDLPGAFIEGLRVEAPDPFMRERLPTSMNTRLIWVKSFFRPDSADRYYLYWDDRSDLDALDIKVEEDLYTDDDFENSVKTLYQRTLCTNCYRTWDTLIIPPGDPYLGAPGLLEAKINAIAARNGFKTCPHCDARLRQMVVKIFQDVGERETAR